METALSPWIVACLALATAVAGAGIAFGVAMARQERTPARDFEAIVDGAVARLNAERAKDVLSVAKYAEEIAGSAEAMKRHRHRIDGAEGGKKRAANADAQLELAEQQEQPRGPQNLDDVMRLAKARGLMQ